MIPTKNLAAFLFLTLLALTATLGSARAATEMTAELATAAANGDLQKIESLIKAKADVNAKTPAGATVLMLAVKYPQIVRALIASGADVNAENFKGGTALMYAVEQNTQESIRYLMTAGAKINHVSAEGVTPLLITANAGTYWLAELLLDSGADIELTGPNGVSALNYAAGSTYQNPDVAANNLRLIHLLVKRGANINSQDTTGETPLMSAAKICSETNIGVLIGYNASLELKNTAGKTAFDLACTFPAPEQWDEKIRKRIQIKLTLKASHSTKEGMVAGIFVGKVFSVSGKKIEITGSGVGKLAVGRKVLIRRASGMVTATVTELLHTKAKARVLGKDAVSAGDPVYLPR